MNVEEFVEALMKAVRNRVAYEVDYLEQLLASGKPSHLVRFSKWIQGLPAEDRDVVRDLLRFTAEGSLFTLLAYIDNSVRLSESEGSFELWFVSPDGSRFRLNDPEGDLLCDVFNSTDNP